MTQYHPFHMVQMSPWPILTGMNLFTLTSGMIAWFHLHQPWLLFISLITLPLLSYQWWRDIINESTFQGHHSNSVVMGLRWGMILFIISEVFFFISFFWAFFHSSLVPSIQIGSFWPPLGINPFNPLHIPLLNTTLLLSSGFTLTFSHHLLINNMQLKSSLMLMLTIVLGVLFSFCQGWEYYQAPFTIADSVYGSTFFLATGFHGLHVLVGTTFLLVCFMRMIKFHFSSYHHFGYEAAAWYWHFVDVVWICLYLILYWWGSLLFNM